MGKPTGVSGNVHLTVGIRCSQFDRFDMSIRLTLPLALSLEKYSQTACITYG